MDYNNNIKTQFNPHVKLIPVNYVNSDPKQL